MRKINKFEYSLNLVDNYDHQCIEKPICNTEEVYRLNYSAVRILIDSMKFGDESDVFGKEKEVGVVEGIINNIYQTSFGVEIYDSVEEKAANLLYYLIKNHPFVDGCKRIALVVFVHYLSMNNINSVDKKVIVPLILLVAHSSSSEKELMVNLIINMIKKDEIRTVNMEEYMSDREIKFQSYALKWQKYNPFLKKVKIRRMLYKVPNVCQRVDIISKLKNDEYITNNISQYLNTRYIPIQVIYEVFTGKTYLKLMTPIDPKNLVYYEVEEIDDGLTLIYLYERFLKKRKVIKDVDNWSFQYIMYFLQEMYSGLNLGIEELINKGLEFSRKLYETKEKVISGRNVIFVNDWKNEPHLTIEYYEDMQREILKKRISFPIKLMEKRTKNEKTN